jgi:hypothetical protein
MGAAAFGGCADDRVGASYLSLRASAALRCSLMGAAAFGGCADDRVGASYLSLRASAALRCSLMGGTDPLGCRSAVLGDQAVEELVL